MFSIHDFIMETLHGMVRWYPDFQVREYALNWYGRGKISEEDLAQVEAWLIYVPEPVSEEPEGPEIIEPEDSEDSEVIGEPVDEPVEEPVDEPVDEPVEGPDPETLGEEVPE